jgi:hypothetical protein
MYKGQTNFLNMDLIGIIIYRILRRFKKHKHPWWKKSNNEKLFQKVQKKFIFWNLRKFYAFWYP